MRDDNRGRYLNAEIGRSSEADGDRGRWGAFLRAGVANGHMNAFDRFYAAGVVRHGALLPQRQDHLGFAVAAARSSHPYRELQARDGLATDDHEVNFELTWRVPINDYVVVQPTCST